MSQGIASDWRKRAPGSRDGLSLGSFLAELLNPGLKGGEPETAALKTCVLPASSGGIGAGAGV